MNGRCHLWTFTSGACASLPAYANDVAKIVGASPR